MLRHDICGHATVYPADVRCGFVIESAKTHVTDRQCSRLDRREPPLGGHPGVRCDAFNGDLDMVCTSLQVELSFRASKDLEVYKLSILKSLMASLSLSVNDQESILEKDIQWLRQKSPCQGPPGS